MSDLFNLAMPWWELVLRAVVVYVALLAMLRLTGKRTIGQFTPFDMVVLVVLGSSVEGSLMGDDVSLPGGLILASTLIGCNWLTGFVAARSRRTRRVIEGTEVVLARNGQVYDGVLRKQNIDRSDLEEALRDNNLADLSEAQRITLEVDGTITVVPRKRGQD